MTALIPVLCETHQTGGPYPPHPETIQAIATPAITPTIRRGSSVLMSIIEKIIQPLLNAQRELGRAEGRAEAYAELYAEDYAEGYAESNAAWRSWLERKVKTESEGKTFDEPPPDARN